MTRSNEAFWWSLFSAGGVMAALFIPAFVIVTGLILPFFADRDPPAADYQHIHEIVSFWPVRIVLFLVIFLVLFHCAHRIRHILMDLGLRTASRTVSVACYGSALVGTVVAVLTLSAL